MDEQRRAEGLRELNEWLGSCSKLAGIEPVQMRETDHYDETTWLEGGDYAVEVIERTDTRDALRRILANDAIPGPGLTYIVYRWELLPGSHWKPEDHELALVKEAHWASQAARDLTFDRIARRIQEAIDVQGERRRVVN